MKLAYVHQLPIEKYPPAVNTLNFFAVEPEFQVLGLTTPHLAGTDSIVNSAVRLIRLPFGGKSDWIVVRWWRSLMWHWLAANVLRKFRPDVVLSIEPHSAFAVWIYFRVFFGTAKLFIHHHEYYSSDDFLKKGNRLTRFNRFFENQLLNEAAWISQTNPDRLRLFSDDRPWLSKSQLSELPNFPPGNWRVSGGRRWPAGGAGVLRLVYVGSVSLHDTFIGPLVMWLNSSAGEGFTLELFACNCDSVTRDFLRAQAGARFVFHERGIPYECLPDLLRTFDVGLILYRCNTLNFRWNATNKFFEYLICGLDVWYPTGMLGVRPYQRVDVVPRVLETDFEQLDQLDMQNRRSRAGLKEAPWTTTCEEPLGKLLGQMLRVAHTPPLIEETEGCDADAGNAKRRTDSSGGATPEGGNA